MARDIYLSEGKLLGPDGHVDVAALANGNATSGLAPRTAVYLPGTSGNYISTPDAAALDITGDLDVRIRWALNLYTGASATQAGPAKWVGTGNQRSYLPSIAANGVPQLSWSSDGVAQVTAQATAGITQGGAVNEEFIWFRWTLDVDNGAGGHEVKFFTSTDDTDDPDTVEWTQLGATVTAAGTTSIFAGTAPTEIGSVNGGTANLAAGKVAAVAIRAGIGGTPVGTLDLSAPVGTRYRDPQGNVWTFNGSGWSWTFR